MTRKPPTPIGLDAEQVRAALQAANGSPTKAARLLGVGRGTVNYWIVKAKIEIRRIVT